MESTKTKDKGYITYLEAKELLKNELDRPVAYQRAFAAIGGGACAGILLSQAWYWTPRANKKCAGWFYKTVEEWERETGLTYSEQKKARKELLKRGLIEEDKRGWNNKNHFRIILLRLVNLLSGTETFVQEISQGKKKRMENLRNNKTISRNVEDDITESSASNLSENSADKNDEFSAYSLIEDSSRYNREYHQEITSENSTKTTRYTQDVLNARHLDGNLDDGEIIKNEILNKVEEKLLCDVGENRQTVKCDEDVSFRNTGGAYKEAELALAAFQSVGANRFDVTFRNEISGHTQYHEDADLTTKLSRALELNETKNVSFIVRPRGASLIQIDDVDWKTVETLLPFIFLAEETSKNNFQAWLALPPNTSEDELKDTRSRLLKKLENTTGNGGSYGATRFPGSINHKPERNGFRVKLIHTGLNLFTTTEQLEKAGLLADVVTQEYKARPTKVNGHPTRFPDYNKCLQAKNFDRSKADASFLAISKARGFEAEEAIKELERVSERVQEEKQNRRPNAYLGLTAKFIFNEEI